VNACMSLGQFTSIFALFGGFIHFGFLIGAVDGARQ